MSEEINSASIEQRLLALEDTTKTLKEENEVLKSANEALGKQNEELREIVEAGRVNSISTDQKKEEKPEIPAETFKIKGSKDEYKFICARFKVPGENPILSKDALKKPQLLAELVKIKSGVIEKVN